MLCAATLFVAIAVSVSTASPRKGYKPLADVVDESTFVCIGRVESVLQIPVPVAAWKLPKFEDVPPDALPIGRIAVERVMKGDAATKYIYAEVWRTWTCDDTQERTGERCLFLLAPGKIAGAPDAVRDAVRQHLGEELVLRNVNSGDGILPILGNGPDAEVSRYSASAAKRNGGILRYVEDLIRFAPELVAVHARCRASPKSDRESWTFDVRILSDGDVRLAQRLDSKEQVSTYRLEEAPWRTLRQQLALALGHGASRIERLDLSKARFLTVRIPEASIDFSAGESFGDPLNLENPGQPMFLPAMRAWAVVRGAIDCPNCADHREADRAWLDH